jgi:TonB-linked SusC/RagA family outer membrane protein
MSLLAQALTVKGIVTDGATKEPLPGVNVIIEGTTIGVITDMNGKFQISVPSSSSVLVFSFIGYLNERIPLEGKSEINIALSPDIKQIDEVVVIGYGTTRKIDLTGTVTSIGSKDIKNIPVASTAEALTGRLAGVQITTTDGSPDAEMVIRVRGGGSVTGDNSPLYIVDGFPVSSISNIPSSDIQNIDVLKDASTTAIYGAQGANGVVIITTKSAKGGKTSVSYNNYFKTKRLSKHLDVMSPYEFVLFNYEYAALRGQTSSDMTNFINKYGVYDDLDLYKYQKGHDYQDDMFGADVTSVQHNISISGGSEKTKYTLSGNYDLDNGLMQNNNYSRYNLNFKLNHEILRNLKFDFNLRVSNTTTNGSGTSGGTYKIRSSQAVTTSPVKGLDEFTEIDITSMTEEEQDEYLRSLLSLSEQAAQYWKKKLQKSYNFTSAISWDIVKGLTYRAELGYEIYNGELKNYWGPLTSQSANEGQNLPLVDWTKDNGDKHRIANTLTYKKEFGGIHAINIMAGQEVVSSGNTNNYIKAKFFSEEMTPEKIFANIGLSSGVNNFSSSSYVSPDNRTLSFFGRVFYSLKDKYLATLTFRTDGSSKFSQDNRWGMFPAGSIAYRISEEDFMKTLSFISNLKIRASYGVVGNDRISSSQYKLSYKISSTGSNTGGKPYGIGEVVNPFYVTTNSQLVNPKIKWETTHTRNIGLDFGFFNERISGTLDAYNNTTKDLLILTKIVAPGYDSQQQNIGQTSNKGIEISLNAYILQHRDYSLSTTFNIGFNRSNVDKLADGLKEQIYNSGWAGTDMKGADDYRVIVGQPVGIIYGFITDGFYTTDDFDPALSVDGKFVLKQGVPTNGLLGGAIGIRPGTIKMKDLNGDGSIDTDNDREIIGNTNPKHTGGFGINGTYKGFDLSVFFNWVYGNDVYNANKIASTQNYRTSYPNLLDIMNSSNRYTYLDQNGMVVTDLNALHEMNEVGENKKNIWSPHSFGSAVVLPHSWAIEDGSFLRLQNITLGYTLPSNLTGKVGASQFRVFCTLNNVWVWTKYTGYDPEVSTAARNNSYSGLTPGVDYSSYPKSFSYTFGMNVTF